MKIAAPLLLLQLVAGASATCMILPNGCTQCCAPGNPDMDPNGPSHTCTTSCPDTPAPVVGDAPWPQNCPIQGQCYNPTEGQCGNYPLVRCFADPCSTVKCGFGTECRSSYCGGCHAQCVAPLKEGDVCKSGGVTSGLGIDRRDECPAGTECAPKPGVIAIGGEVDWTCQAPLFCTEDAKLCPDGSYVSRDPKNGCEFEPCPVCHSNPDFARNCCTREVWSCEKQAWCKKVSALVAENPDVYDPCTGAKKCDDTESWCPRAAHYCRYSFVSERCPKTCGRC